MKKKLSPVWFGSVLIFIVQLTCTMGNLPAQYECEMEGGIWHTPILEEPGWCEKKSQPENEDAAPAETMPNEPPINPPIEEKEAYVSPIPPLRRNVMPRSIEPGCDEIVECIRMKGGVS